MKWMVYIMQPEIELNEVLPYTLMHDHLTQRKVTATKEGLLFEYSFGLFRYNNITSWREAKEVLQFREGEPWCYGFHMSNIIVCCDGTMDYVKSVDGEALHKTASCICNNAYDLAVLIQCLKEFT